MWIFKTCKGKSAHKAVAFSKLLAFMYISIYYVDFRYSKEWEI